MKRLALALVATALGAGCGTHRAHCASTMTLSWDFLMFDGARTSSCAAAGTAGNPITWIDVYVDGQLAVSGADCGAGGVVISDVGPGAHDVTVEAFDATNTIAYRDQLTTNGATACGNVDVATEPAEGTATLDATYGGTACPGGTPCYLWFSVTDTISGTVASTISQGSSTATKQTFPYGSPARIRLPVGTFSLDWLQLVSGSFSSVAITCAPTSFTVNAASDTPVAASLTCQ